MSADLIKEIKVFKISVTDSGNTFGPDGGVLVASLSADKNCYPHAYKWGINFVCDAKRFEAVAALELANYFEMGLLQATFIDGYEQCIKHITDLHQASSDLTVDDMHGMGYYGYSLPDNCLGFLPSHNLKRIESYLGVRHGSPLSTVDQLNHMIDEVLTIKACPNLPFSDLWCSEVWALDEQGVISLANTPLKALSA